ncbi:MAG: hypothetical protein ACYSR4_10965 [Planctomycetota bacterium]
MRTFPDSHPVFRPGDVVFAFYFVVVFVVLIADVEGRVGKDKVGEGSFDFAENLYAIAADYLIQKLLHSHILYIDATLASGKTEVWDLFAPKYRQEDA